MIKKSNMFELDKNQLHEGAKTLLLTFVILFGDHLTNASKYAAMVQAKYPDVFGQCWVQYVVMLLVCLAVAYALGDTKKSNVLMNGVVISSLLFAFMILADKLPKGGSVKEGMGPIGDSQRPIKNIARGGDQYVLGLTGGYDGKLQQWNDYPPEYPSPVSYMMDPGSVQMPGHQTRPKTTMVGVPNAL